MARQPAIVFEIGDTACALPAAALREILEQAHVSPAPMAPASIEGVLNRLGQLYVVFDLGSLIGTQLRMRSHVLLFGSEKLSLAAWVDGVVGVADAEADRITMEASLPFQTATLQYRGRIVPYLDAEKLFQRVDELV
jgi:chemotaxis signal transduction protein